MVNMSIIEDPSQGFTHPKIDDVYKVGEVFDFFGHHIEVINDNGGCKGCFFSDRLFNCLGIKCTFNERLDGNSVKFIEKIIKK